MPIPASGAPPHARSLVWFRRDLRAFDHAALHHALKHSSSVFCVFIFDQEILQELPRVDRRVDFIHASVDELQRELTQLGGGLTVLQARAIDAIPALARDLGVSAVFANHDYEPYALARDAAVAAALLHDQVAWCSYKDQVIFEKNEVLSLAGTPFSVFTRFCTA